MRIAAALLFLTLSAAVAAPEVQSFRSASGVVWYEHAFKDQAGDRGRYFVYGDNPTGKTIILLQGSGCVPAFSRMAGRDNVATSGQDSFAKILDRRANLMVVERPGLHRNDPLGPTPGQSEGCNRTFLSRYSLEDWGAVVQSAMDDWRRNAGSQQTEALLGISEGIKTATWMAHHGFRGPIGGFGGEGCDGDIVGMIARAVQRAREKRPGPSLDEELHMVEDIRAHPRATDRFAWGHTYLRWSSFGDQCSQEGLERYPGLVFFAYGTGDTGADVTGIERLVHYRQSRGLPAILRRIEGGDHGLFVGESDRAMPTFAEFVTAILR